MAPKNRAASTVEDTAPTETTQGESASRALDTVDALNAVQFATDELRGITSFEDALRLAQEQFGAIDEAGQVLGDGFALLKDDGKSRLVGVPLLLLEWNFYDGEFGSKFVAVRIATRNPDGGVGKYIINDGSTGIAEMLADYTRVSGKQGGLFVRNGLRPSNYTYCEACGKPVSNVDTDSDHRAQGKHKRATTYYLDTSL